jgi:alkanesulfonate monooxygenase SsuD/methylene tetrahydromethanopterin reductase-like flavin-dependent oxidoreductase (luciferase family)
MGLPDIAALAREAEAAGFDCIWAEDVLYRGDATVLDISCVLSAVSAATTTIEVGSAIYAPSLRNLAWSLKQVVTVNLIARGRLTLGVALGSASQDEYHLAGQARPGQRKRTEEFLSIMAAWSRGQLYDEPIPSWVPALLLAGAISPPPLWLGGTSGPALRRAARFGDGWLSGAQTPGEFRASVAELQRLADEESRPCPKVGVVLSAGIGPGHQRAVADSAALMQSLYGTPQVRAQELAIGGDAERVADEIAPYLDAGAERLAVVCATLPWSESWPILADVRRIIGSR